MNSSPSAARLAMLALCAGGCVVPAGTLVQDRPAAGVEDAVVLAVARLVVEAAPLVAGVWPGYWPVEQGFVLMPFRGGALLVANDQAPGSLPPADDDLPAALRGIAFLVEARPTHLSAWGIDFGYEVRGRRYPAVGVLDASVPDRELAVLTFLYHEAFHAYQLHRFRDRGAGLADLHSHGSLAADPIDGALRDTERRLLLAALDDSDADSAAAAVWRYVAVRGHRLARMSGEQRDRDVRVETMEGSAQFVGHQAAYLALGRPATAAAAAMARELAELAHEPDRNPVEEYRRHLYVSGAAIGLILDRMGASWRDEIESGSTLWEVLEHKAGPVDLAQAEFQRILATHGYDEAITARRLHHVRRDPLGEFEDHSGFRVIIDGFRIVDRRSVGEFDRPVPGVIVHRKGSELEIRGPDAEWASQAHPVLIEWDGAAARVVIVLPTAPVVSPGTDANRDERLGDLQLTAPGFSARIRRPAHLVETDDSVRVTIGRQPPG